MTLEAFIFRLAIFTESVSMKLKGFAEHL